MQKKITGCRIPIENMTFIPIENMNVQNLAATKNNPNMFSQVSLE